MHEMSIAMAVVEQVEESPAAAGRDAVSALWLSVGQLAGVVPDALDFCFGLVASDTVCEGAELHIETVAARAACEGCALEWDTGMPPDLCCPSCRTATSGLLSGRELQITAVEWADDPRPSVSVPEEF